MPEGESKMGAADVIETMTKYPELQPLWDEWMNDLQIWRAEVIKSINSDNPSHFNDLRFLELKKLADGKFNELIRRAKELKS